VGALSRHGQRMIELVLKKDLISERLRIRSREGRDWRFGQTIRSGNYNISSDARKRLVWYRQGGTRTSAEPFPTKVATKVSERRG